MTNVTSKRIGGFWLTAAIFIRAAKRPLGVALAVLLAVLPIVPVKAKAETYLDLNAKAAILIEQTTGKMLYGKDEHARMYPASMTKILTGLVAMDYVQPDELVVVGAEINTVPIDSSKAGHKVGETITMHNLLRGLLMRSGNESSCVIASYVVKKIRSNNELSYTEAEKAFCELMNEKAKSLGALDSHFSNPHGYHDENHYSTAYDMALISQAAMNNELLGEIFGETSFEGNGAGPAADATLKTQQYNWESHNLLLVGVGEAESYPYATGIKTGFTNEASDCLAASASKDGIDLISVVFYSPDPGRWNDSKKLFDYGFNSYAFETVQQAGDILDTAPIANHRLGESDTMEIAAQSDYINFYSKDELLQIQKTITYMEEYIFIDEEEENASQSVRLRAPIQKSAVIGTVTYTLQDEVVYEGEVLATADAESRSFQSDVNYYWGQFKKNVFTLKALPYWGIGIALITGLIAIITTIRRRKSRDFYRLRRRY